MKRKPDDEGNTDQAKRININFSVPPPNMQLQPQIPQPILQPMLPQPQQPDGGYYMNNLNNGPWRGGRGNPRGGGGGGAQQNFGGFNNNRGAQNMWRPPRGAGPNQRNFRGGPGGYFRGGMQKGNNQFGQQNFYGNQGFNGPNNFNGPFQQNQNFQGGQWPGDNNFPNNQEDGGGGGGGKGKGQNNPRGRTPKNRKLGGQGGPGGDFPGGPDLDLTEEGATSKSKRRSMSQSYPSRPWDRDAAEKALAVEMEFLKALRNQNLIIRFPDPDLNKDIVKAFHPDIVNVHFQVPSGPRFCFVQLEEDADADKVMADLSSKEFGNGILHVEKRGTKEDDNLSAESIDPFTLYIGNLPSTITIQTMREKFPTAARIDVGYAQRMKFTRYAFIRYHTAEVALDAFRESHNLQLENRSVIVRFRRQRGPTAPTQNPSKKQKSEGETVGSKQKAKKEKAAAAAALVAATKPVSAVKSEEGGAAAGEVDDEGEEEEEEETDEEEDSEEDDEADVDDDDDDTDEEEEEDDEDDEEDDDEPATATLPLGTTADDDDEDDEDEDDEDEDDDDDDD